MSSLKNTVDKIKNLEAEKLRLLSEVEELKRMAQAKSDNLANEISALREEINSLKDLIGPKQPPPSFVDLKQIDFSLVRGLADKTQNESKQLGAMVFPSTPFSQHFDGWLARLQKVISDFEADPHVKMDEQFVRDRSQIILEIEGTLAKIKAEELNVDSFARALADSNRLLVQIDREYAEKSKEFNGKKEMEIQRLTGRVRELETQLRAEEEENKNRKLLKKKIDDKVPNLMQEIRGAKNELETAQEIFEAQREQLDSNYEKKKQAAIAQAESSRAKLDQIEIDLSAVPRQTACQALSNAVNALVQRTATVA